MTADEFRAWRERHGLSQAAAARALRLALTKDGTTSDAIRHYERGTRSVPGPVEELCRYIDVHGLLSQ